MSKHKRQPLPFPRKLHIGNTIWSWRYSHNIIMIHNPDCSQTWRIHTVEMFNITYEVLERTRWKRSTRYQIKPSVVKEYIEKNTQNGQLVPPKYNPLFIF
jgi:hypothetical protein